jgi:hypothetical protein
MNSSLEIMPYMMAPGDAEIVAATIGRYLRHPGQIPQVPEYSGAAASVAGTWSVTIQYVRGIGHQQLVLQQDGKTVSGEQKGEIFQAKLHGDVQADRVTLRSLMRPPGYYLPYMFKGVVSGNTFSGEVAMGEYGNGTFVATRV